jgi:hypothetical protein
MKVLHDYDEPYLSAKYAIRRGLKLILYGMCRFLGIRISLIDEIYQETRKNADTLIKIDKLVGICPIMGIRDKVVSHYPNIISELEKYGADIRTHIHIGKAPDINRIRTWDPIDDLENITSNVWHYDKNYVLNKRPLLKEGELPIWHVDRPNWLKYYVDFLYEMLIEKAEL